MTKRLRVAAVLVLAVTIIFGKAEAKSKSNPVVEVNIPFSFQLGNRTLPAGTYKFELATGIPGVADTMSVLVVRNFESHIYQAIAVPVKAGAGLGSESRAVFSGGDLHTLVAVWESGDRLDLRPGGRAVVENDDDWSNGEQLVTVAFRSDWR
jgi:hypothetical protein